MQRKRWLALAGALALVAALALVGEPARAEERPITVPLSYIVNLSNTGATTATGTAEIWRTEAEVKLTVQGMTPLPANANYAVWLVNPQTGTFLPVGRFTVSATGNALSDVSLAGSLPSGLSMVLVTVQPHPDPHQTVASSKYSIIGFFPGNTAIQHQVHNLPDTGQYAQHPPWETNITPDAPAAPPAPTSPPWLPFAPLALALLSLIFVTRRTLKRKG